MPPVPGGLNGTTFSGSPDPRNSPNIAGRCECGFLRERVLPAYRAAGGSLQRILTDQGTEYRGTFDPARREHGIRPTRTQPRHPWTHGFGQRLQGTKLTELWRIELRRRFFTRVATVQDVLDRYLAFDNYQRPHLG